MRTLSLLALGLVASMGASLLAVWAVSSLAGFTFNPSVVVVLSATMFAVAVATARRRKGDAHRNAG